MKLSKQTPHFILISLLFSLPPALYAARSEQAMVVTQDSRATRAAVKILQRGGNAVDAAIAAQWVLNVVQPQSSGIGGGGFFLYYDAAKKAVYAFDGREEAPAAAFPEMFLDEDGAPLAFRPHRNTGGLAVGVPGTLKLLHEVHKRLASGQFSFAELFDPAIEFAERGIRVSPELAAAIDKEKDRLKLFESSAKIFFDREGKPLTAGKWLKQPALAKTFRQIQLEGVPVFYEGAIAGEMVRAVREAVFNPGYLDKDDLFYYQIKEREAVQENYRDHTIFGIGPPSAGAVTLIETLKILERFRLELHAESPDGIHLLVEAQKLAYQDRSRFLGDPDFSKVPAARLISEDWVKERAGTIQFETALPTEEAAARPLSLEGTHTSHLSIVDRDGNMAAYTTTLESLFGSALVVPGRGFLLNNELSDFEPSPRDEKGKLYPNAPEGQKRPLSSMAPTFVFREGEPYLILGTPGGPAIIGILANVLVNLIDFKLPLEEALQRPRAVSRSGLVELETDLYREEDLRRELERRGHPVMESLPLGNVQAIFFDTEEGEKVGASDPRGEGEALGT